MNTDTFAALAEPSRFQIVELLRGQPLAVGDLAEAMGIRQPQASKHLRVLRDAGLVGVEQVARRRVHHLRPEAFTEIADWADSFEKTWEARLDSLGAYLDQTKEEISMILKRSTKKKELSFERTYAAPIETVWDAWTNPETLRQWWGPPKTSVVECDVDLRVGGRVKIVMEAGKEMGKYAGTQWPMEGTFTAVEQPARLSYDARSWTEGDDDTTIEHVNEITLTADGANTVVSLQITINSIGGGAKMAVMGMKMGYSAQLKKLKAHLEKSI